MHCVFNLVLTVSRATPALRISVQKWRYKTWSSLTDGLLNYLKQFKLFLQPPHTWRRYFIEAHCLLWHVIFSVELHNVQFCCIIALILRNFGKIYVIQGLKCLKTYQITQKCKKFYLFHFEKCFHDTFSMAWFLCQRVKFRLGILANWAAVIVT